MNELFNALNYAISSSVSSIVVTTAQFVPRLLGAIIVFSLGVILGGWAKTLIIKILKTISFSRYFASEAVKKFLEQAQIHQTAETVIGEIVRASVIVIFFISSINLLGLTTLSQVLSGILAYIPNVFGASIIFVVGILIAGIVEKLIKGSFGSIDIKTGRGAAKLASYTIVIFTTMAAFSQLGIAQNLVNIIFIGFIATLAIGLGLSLGLGSKGLVQKLLEDWYKNLKKDIQ